MHPPSPENWKRHLDAMSAWRRIVCPAFGKPSVREVPRALGALPLAALLFVMALPGEVLADGMFDGITGNLEMNYSHASFRTTDSSGNTTKTEFNNYNPRAYLNLNYDLYPKLNLNAGANFEMNIVEPANTESGSRTEVTRLFPFVWLSLRDPIYDATVGYTLNEATTTTSGQKNTLTQETYNASLNWKPEGLPWTKALFNLTNTNDTPRSLVDTQKNFGYLKSEYLYKGLDVWYAGTYLNTQDKIRDFDSTQFTNEGRLIYNTTLFNGRTNVNTDNRVVFTTFDTSKGGQGQIGLSAFPVVGLSSLTDTPAIGVMGLNPALIDGNLTASAGVDLVLPPVGGDPRRRNMGVGFSTLTELNSLQVWVSVTDTSGGTVPPQNVPNLIPSLFSWDIYTSTANQDCTTVTNWTFFQTIQSAPFGPFDSRFEINFPSASVRCIKVVTRPVPSSALAATNIRQIVVTEIQAFLNASGQSLNTKTNQTFQYYSLDARTRVLDSPLLTYYVNGYYTELSPNGQQQYDITNGLQFNHIINQYLSTNANAAVDYGAQGGETNLNFTYSASLMANPLKTLMNSLVFSGSNQRFGDATDFNNSVVLYNTAQLYKGIDANLNLGWVLLSHSEGGGISRKQNDVYVNVGTNITPTPNLNLTLYYFGRKSNISGSEQTTSGDVLENRIDFGASWLPLSTLSLTALINASYLSGSTNAGASGQRNNVQQNYGLSWAPFPDGQLQFNLFFSQSYNPDKATTFQPTLRWYLTPRRRSFLDLTYLKSDTNSAGTKTETNVISATLKIFF
jgi:hypothetical protein